MKRSIKKDADSWICNESDKTEMAKYLNSYETPLRASQAYCQEKSKKWTEEQGRGYYERVFQFFFLKHAPVEYIK